jgi:hypothetical protein
VRRSFGIALALIGLCGLGRAADVSWRAYADCAAGYRANWQDRLADPHRTPQMRDMIRQQADDYQTAAVRHYREQTGADEPHAQEAVRMYVEANTDRFIALDKRDELNPLLDKCPQPDDSGTL